MRERRRVVGEQGGSGDAFYRTCGKGRAPQPDVTRGRNFDAMTADPCASDVPRCAIIRGSELVRSLRRCPSIFRGGRYTSAAGMDINNRILIGFFIRCSVLWGLG